MLSAHAVSDQRIPKKAILEEKRRFIKRWPDRNYQPRWNDTKITCETTSQQCTIEGIADFEAKSSARGKQERGTLRYSMGIKLIEGDVRIVAEKSEVVERAD
jgi:hypothetical protein